MANVNGDIYLTDKCTLATILDPFLVNEKEVADSEGGYPVDYPLDYGYEGTGSDMDDASVIGSVSIYSTESEAHS